MQSEIEKVKQFHHAAASPVATEPTLLAGQSATASDLASQLRQLLARASDSAAPADLLVARAHMSIEELAEWLEAHAQGDLVAAADAWADRCYVLIGDAVAAGLPAVELFEAVHQSNMTKAAVNQIDGKAVKGRQYKRPRIETALGLRNGG